MEKGAINNSKIVVIGGSAGSLDVLLQLVPSLKPAIDYPIVIVLHRRGSGDDILTDLLATRTTLTVKEIEEKETLAPGTIYIAPGDYHLLFEKDNTCSLDYSEKLNYSRPSIDIAFESAAVVYGNSLTCILLSGANADGAEGCRQALAHGAITIAQLPSTAEVPFMPIQAINGNAITHIYNVKEMAAYMNGM
jgi:two-component system chemotaxis response regulator CheB